MDEPSVFHMEQDDVVQDLDIALPPTIKIYYHIPEGCATEIPDDPENMADGEIYFEPTKGLVTKNIGEYLVYKLMAFLRMQELDGIERKLRDYVAIVWGCAVVEL